MKRPSTELPSQVSILIMNCPMAYFNILSLSLSLSPDGPMDTKPEAASKVTFIPSLVTFEEEMFQKYGHQASPSSEDSNTEAVT